MAPLVNRLLILHWGRVRGPCLPTSLPSDCCRLGLHPGPSRGHSLLVPPAQMRTQQVSPDYMQLFHRSISTHGPRACLHKSHTLSSVCPLPSHLQNSAHKSRPPGSSPRTTPPAGPQPPTMTLFTRSFRHIDM